MRHSPLISCIFLQRNSSLIWMTVTIMKKCQSKNTMRTVRHRVDIFIKNFFEFNLIEILEENDENFELALAKMEETSKDKLTVCFGHIFFYNLKSNRFEN